LIHPAPHIPFDQGDCSTACIEFSFLLGFFDSPQFVKTVTDKAIKVAMAYELAHMEVQYYTNYQPSSLRLHES
jgi:hypothetical protein